MSEIEATLEDLQSGPAAMIARFDRIIAACERHAALRQTTEPRCPPTS
jgi:hypothetical protein